MNARVQKVDGEQKGGIAKQYLFACRDARGGGEICNLALSFIFCTFACKINNMKRITFTFGLILLMNWASSNPIGPVKAQQLAETFWQQSGCAVRSGISANALTDITAQTDFSHLYIFSNAGGFVILSADDCARPVLAYSTSGSFDPEIIPAPVRDWLFTYENRIEDAVNQHLEATAEISAQWELLQSGHWGDAKASQTVNPLITAQWGQSSPYNAACPSNTLVGCVAVAMGQVMHYWQYPEHGTGSHSYTYNGFTHNVDFSAATYNWNAMPNSCSSANSDVATLLYHCGVAIETSYTSSNSTAYVLNSSLHPYNAESALKNFFGYSSQAHGELRSNYDKTSWLSMLKSNLDAGIPIIYNGFNSSYSGGHCFICDGYDANDFFHFNWGLKGSYDGYYEIDDMTPSNQNFSYNQGAIIDLVPSTEGIEDHQNATLLVYPNPTSGIINIECNYANLADRSFCIYDSFGKLLILNNLTKENCTIDLSAQPAGIYFLHLMKNGETTVFQKIVKVH